MNRGQPRKRSVTQRDVAAHCDLSVMTVSMALRGDCRNLRPETVARARAAAQALGYDLANATSARRLRYSATEHRVVNQLVGFYYSLRYVLGPYAVRLLHALGAVLDEAEFALLSNWTPANEGPLRKLPALFGRGEVDGVLTLSGIRNMEAIIAGLRAEPGFGDRPIVSMMEAQAECSCVLVDDEGGGRMLMSHLLDLGHREVLCVEFTRWQHRQRFAGCRRACRERGLDPEQAVRPLAYNSDDPESSRRQLFAILRQYPHCRAIFAGNDQTACTIAQWLADAGWRIPQDLSLIGYDDTHVLPGPAGQNLLTSVRLPLEEVGRQSATLLLQQIRGEITENQTLTLPVELVVRGSCAPAR